MLRAINTPPVLEDPPMVPRVSKMPKVTWFALMWCICLTREHARSRTLTLPNTAPAIQQVSIRSIKNHRANHLQAVLTEGNFPQDIAQADRELNGLNGSNTFPECGTALAFCEAKASSARNSCPFSPSSPRAEIGWIGSAGSSFKRIKILWAFIPSA